MTTTPTPNPNACWSPYSRGSVSAYVPQPTQRITEPDVDAFCAAHGWIRCCDVPSNATDAPLIVGCVACGSRERLWWNLRHRPDFRGTRPCGFGRHAAVSGGRPPMTAWGAQAVLDRHRAPDRDWAVVPGGFTARRQRCTVQCRSCGRTRTVYMSCIKSGGAVWNNDEGRPPICTHDGPGAPDGQPRLIQPDEPTGIYVVGGTTLIWGRVYFKIGKTLAARGDVRPGETTAHVDGYLHVPLLWLGPDRYDVISTLERTLHAGFPYASPVPTGVLPRGGETEHRCALPDNVRDRLLVPLLGDPRLRFVHPAFAALVGLAGDPRLPGNGSDVWEWAA